MFPSRMISWLAIAGVLSVLSGCGSSSPGVHSTATASRTPAQSAALAAYLGRGDDVCRAGERALAPIDARGAEIRGRHSGSRREAELLVPVLRQGLREYRRFYERLKRIAPPPEDRATVATILDGLRRVGDDLQRLTGALQRGETGAVKTITSEREVDHARVSALELEFGFKVCGQPASPESVAG